MKNRSATCRDQDRRAPRLATRKRHLLFNITTIIGGYYWGMEGDFLLL